MLARSWLIPLIVAVTGLFALWNVRPVTGQIRKDGTDRAREVRRRPETALTLSVDTLSKYVYRGYAYSEGNVHQIDLNAEYGAFTFDCFANYDPEVDQVNEVLTGPGLALSIDEATVYLGYLFTYEDFEDQYFESQTETTQEVYAGVTLPNDVVTPSAFAYYDFDKGDGTYYEFWVEKTFGWQTTELYIAGLLSYNDNYFLDESGWSHTEFSLAVTADIHDDAAIEISTRYSEPFDTGEEFGEIPFVDGGVALESPLTNGIRMRLAINHATPLDDTYDEETWCQASLIWSH